MQSFSKLDGAGRCFDELGHTCKQSFGVLEVIYLSWHVRTCRESLSRLAGTGQRITFTRTRQVKSTTTRSRKTAYIITSAIRTKHERRLGNTPGPDIRVSLQINSIICSFVLKQLGTVE